jgi:DNA-binding CsgD family transcriptional regulator
MDSLQERILNDLIEVAYEAPLDKREWAPFLEGFEAAMKGAVLLALPHPGADHPGRLLSAALGTGFLTLYQSHFVAHDPFLPQMEQMAVGALAPCSELLGSQRLATSSYSRNWLELEKLTPQILAVVDRDWEHGTSSLFVFRHRGEPACGPEELRLIEQLLPHLRRSVRIYFQTVQDRAERRALAEVLDRLRTGVLLVNGRGRVSAKNRAADRILRAGGGFSLDREGLHLPDASQDLALKRLIREAVTNQTQSSITGLQIMRLHDRCPLCVWVAPIRTLPGGVGSEGISAAIFVNDPEAPSYDCELLLRRQHGLTAAEAALAWQIASGRALDEAAQHLGIRLSTARSRLKQIFQKTGTSRQAALACLVLSGAGQLCDDS